jgi:uncharacterized coiled-coil protein SlyX
MNGANQTIKRRRNVIIIMGIICVLLIAGLGGTIAYYALAINNKQSELDSANITINQLNTTIAKQDDSISQLNSTVTNLQNEIASDNVTLEKLQNELDNLTGSENSTETFATSQGLYDGFQLTLALEKTNFSLGEPINVTLILTNISDQTVSFWLDFSFSYFQFFVYDSTNSEIYSSLYNGGALLPLAVQFTLNPGQSMSDVFSWPQTIFSPEGVPVSPGTYYIVGQVGPIQEANSTIETTPIQITIS